MNNIANFVTTLPNLKAFIDLRSYGQMRECAFEMRRHQQLCSRLSLTITSFGPSIDSIFVLMQEDAEGCREPGRGCARCC